LNFRALLKLLGALLGGAVAYSLLRELLGEHILSGVYIPIPVTPPASAAQAPGTQAPGAQVVLAGPSTVNVTMPSTARPDPSKTTVAFSVAVYAVEIGLGSSGRDLKIKKLKSSDFDTPPPASLDIVPGATLPVTFQIKSSAGVDHAAVIVASTVQKARDGDGLYRGVGIVVIT